MVIRMLDQIASSNAAKEDSLAKLIGHFGKWQFIVFASIFLVKLSSGWVQMVIIFLTPPLTSFWCSKFDGNVTEVAVNSTCYTDCLEYQYDTSPFENTIISEWDLVCERQWLASFTQTVLQLGILIGSIVFGFLSDRYGRKNTFLASIALLVAVGFAIPFSPNYTVFTALRFCLGFATAGTMVVSFVIIMETVGPRYREVLGCLFQIPFIIGHLTTPLFAYYYRSWDHYTLAIAIPPVIYLGYFLLLTESPRWLISVGRVDEATRIVTKAAEMNNLPTTHIQDSLACLSKEILHNKTDEPKLNYIDLFRTQSLRKRTLCCFVIWLCGGLTFFGLNQYIGQTSPDPFVSVAAAAALQIPSNFLAMWLTSNYSRKTTTSLFFCLGGLFSLALGCVPNIFWLTLTLGSLGVSCGAIFNTTIYIYSTELFPTVARNMGMGVCSMSMRIGSMIAPFVANVAPSLPWLPTVVFGVAPLIAGGVTLLLPETKNRSLPDSVEDVEGDNK